MNINRMTSDKVKRKQELKIPRDPALWEGRTVTADQDDVDVRDVEETDKEVEEAVDEAPEENEGGII